MYLCVTADAPRKCHDTEEPPPKPERFTGLKVMRMDNIMEDLRKGNLEELRTRDVAYIYIYVYACEMHKHDVAYCHTLQTLIF